MRRFPLWKQSVEDEVREELELHLELRTREYQARGLDPAAARAAARRRFGDLDKVVANCRKIGRKRDDAMRRRDFLAEVKQDAGFALRQLLAQPGFTLIAVLTLALGIGASTAIFSVVNAVVLRPLPFPRPERLVSVIREMRGEPEGTPIVSAGNYTRLAAEQRSFEAIGAQQFASFNLTPVQRGQGGGGAERVTGARVTASFFAVFGVRPALGRVFRDEEDAPGREQVVVLSHRLWQSRFGGEPGAVGREVRMNGQLYTVLGVMPERFELRYEEDLWVPIAFSAERRVQQDEHYLQVVGRLRDGVSLRQAGADLAAVAAGLRRSHPRENRELGFRLTPLAESYAGPYRRRLLVLLGAVGLVLLIACCNVANLLLARGAVRSRELAIRAALGAGRARIVRQLLTESAILGLVSAAGGLLVAAWGMRALVRLAPEGVPRLAQTSVDAAVLAFAVGLALASSFVFGLAPAFRAARSRSAPLREGRGAAAAGGAGRDGLRSLLITAEVALTVLLLVGAGLLIRSALALQRVELGFEPAGVITARLTLPEAQYREPEPTIATFERLLAEVELIPGVSATALASQIPLTAGGNNIGLKAEGRETEDSLGSDLGIVTPDYFRALGMNLVRGRGFTDADRRGAPKVMILNETAARLLFPGRAPLGKRVHCCERGPNEEPDYKTVVGIAADLRSSSPAEPPVPEFYLPLRQAPPKAWAWIQHSLYLVARSERAPELLLPAVRGKLAAIDPDVPLYSAATLEERMAESLATARFNTLLLTLLGTIGLLLSAVGIYGVAGYFVNQRIPEIGVRMALGATPGRVVGLVLRQAVAPVAAGLALGLAGSLAATRLLAASLVGVDPGDPATLAAVVLVLAAAAFLASVLPARRAAGVDPTRALSGS